jgi:mRNA interferase MazF
MHRGEVWWADIPGDTRRPVLILTRERFIPRLTSLLVAPITTTVRDIPTEVELGSDDGMPTRCAANFDNTFTLGVDRFVAPLTALSDARMEQVCAAYRFAAGC